MDPLQVPLWKFPYQGLNNNWLRRIAYGRDVFVLPFDNIGTTVFGLNLCNSSNPAMSTWIVWPDTAPANRAPIFNRRRRPNKWLGFYTIRLTPIATGSAPKLLSL